MALGQRRMVYTNLWQNTDFAKLSDKAKLLYIGIITVADDDGRLRGNSLLLRSQIFPLDETVSVIEIRKWLNEIVRTKLVTFYKVVDEYYVQHPNWDKYQNIRKDLYKPSKIPTLRNRNETVTKTLPKLSKDKLSKERSKTPYAYFSKIPEKDLNEFMARFDCSKSALLSKIEDLKLYCQKNGKKYRNYKAFILSALKKDFPKRSSLPPQEKNIPVIPMTIPIDIKESIDKIVNKAKMI